jgi:hypothetical protein
MSRMRFRRSADCSRQNSRRNNAKSLITLILLLLLVSFGTSAQEARVDATLRGGVIYGTVEYLGSHSQEVLASLWDGLRAEISFQLRVYKRSSGLLSFLGDRLLKELRVYKVASFDFYENRYKVQKSGREAGEYDVEADFLEAFFSLHEVDLGEIESAVPGDYYLMARVRMMPVKIIAPLNIITLFSSDTVFTTHWVEADLSP